MNNKSRYNRVHYTSLQIDELFEKFRRNYQLNVEYKSLFNDKIFDSKKLWKNDIIRKLDNKSCNLFFYKLEIFKNGEEYCRHCKSNLDISSYSYRHYSNSFNERGFTKYCNSCTSNKIWNTKSGNKNFNDIGRKISVSKKAWSKTKSGISFYKELGIKNSSFLIKYFKTDEGKLQLKKSGKKISKIIRKNIESGKFTPNISNSWTHWDAYIIHKNKKIKFRSSWEACFWECNKHLLYEKLRIPYFDSIKKCNRVYIADFFDIEKNILYEIKPKSIFLIQKNKMDCIIKYCLENDIRFIWINEKNILNYVREENIHTDNMPQYFKLLKGISNEKNASEEL